MDGDIVFPYAKNQTGMTSQNRRELAFAHCDVIHRVNQFYLNHRLFGETLSKYGESTGGAGDLAGANVY